MKPDWFLTSFCDVDGTMTPEVLKTLSEHAEQYLRMGGHLSWAEWQLLSAESRAMWVEAGNRLRAEMASDVARMVQDLVGDQEAAEEGIRKALENK